MKLGDLKFNEEDFAERALSFEAIVERINALLIERLGKARRVYQVDVDKWSEAPAFYEDLLVSGRLVCIQEIE